MAGNAEELGELYWLRVSEFWLINLFLILILTLILNIGNTPQKLLSIKLIKFNCQPKTIWLLSNPSLIEDTSQLDFFF